MPLANAALMGYYDTRACGMATNAKTRRVWRVSVRL